MKAVLLVGGGGTRLRPLTVHTPKPLIPLLNRPFLDHVLYNLRLHDITDVVLAVAYRSESFEQTYGSGSHLDMRLTYVREEEPMGTGGAIKNVESYLDDGDAFFVFNGDVLTDLDLSDMLRFHRESGSICTISLTPVEDPSHYGVVDLDDRGRIERFTEKPKREEATSNWINAGTYVLEPQVLQYIPTHEFHMVERGLFPNLLHMDKPLYGYRSGAYWLDIGTPAKYLQAQDDLLAGRLKQSLSPTGEEITDGVWVGKGCDIHDGARLTGPVVLGKGCRVEEGAAITGPCVLGRDCTVSREAEVSGSLAWDGAAFGEKCNVREAIIGAGASVGAESHLEGVSVVGDGAQLGARNHLSNGVRIWPGVTLPDDAITF